MRLKTFKITGRTKQEKGFSLLELLLYIGIFSMLLVTLFQLLTSIFDVQLESTGSSSVDQDGLFIMNRLTYDIQQATSIATPSAAGLTTSAFGFVAGGSTYKYSTSSGNLILANLTAGTADQLNSVNTTVSNPSFTLLTDTQGKNFETLTISFKVTATAVDRNSSKSKTFKTTIGVR